VKISVQGLSFGYGFGEKVLEGIDLELEGPGLICIIGPNGVGKSTLVKCMNGLLKPSSGSVMVDGRSVASMKKSEIADRISYVPAVGMDCFSMPVMDAIMVGRHRKQGWRTTEADIKVVYDVMELLGITDLAMHGYNELSAGQHQKVSLARGIVQDTDIMILDEPTANLDVKHQVYVTQMLRALADIKGKLIVMICHDLNIAARYASKIVVMAPPGRVDCIGDPNDVITEDMVGRIYGIGCEVRTFEGRPLIVLGSSFSSEDKLVEM